MAGAVPPAPDAIQSLDVKAATPSADLGAGPRVVKLLGEAWRHAKPIGALAAGTGVLASAAIPQAGRGVVLGASAELVEQFAALLAGHRVWARFEPASRPVG